MKGPASEEERLAILRLAKLVTTMRELQRRYFRGDRSPALMGLCKDAERTVDVATEYAIQKWGAGPKGPEQPSLFAVGGRGEGAYGPRGPPASPEGETGGG